MWLEAWKASYDLGHEMEDCSGMELTVCVCGGGGGGGGGGGSDHILKRIEP